MNTNDKYNQEEKAQVRDIINKLHEEKPGQESNREVVTREDGSKVVRVTRKRRVLITEKDKRRHSRRIFLLGVFVLLASFAGFMLYFLWNLYNLSNSDSLEKLSGKLQTAFGAELVEISGIEIKGFEMQASSATIHFAESSHSLIDRIELTGISADLLKSGVLRGVYATDSMKVNRINFVMRADADEMRMSLPDLSEMIEINRLICPDFNLTIGEDLGTSPLSIVKTELYVTRNKQTERSYTAVLDNGSFIVRRWREFEIVDARFRVSDAGVNELNLELTMPIKNKVSSLDAQDARMSVSGTIMNGDSVYGAYDMNCHAMSLDVLTGSRLLSFFTGTLKSNVVESAGVNDSQLSFKPQGGTPDSRGIFYLENVQWRALPALSIIQSHLPADRRSNYITLNIPRAQVELDATADHLSLQFDEEGMAEKHLITLEGSLQIDAVGNINGVLNYGLPATLMRAEYMDGICDPVFEEKGTLAWLNTTVSGTARAPQDNAAVLEASKSEERAKRAEQRRSLDTSVEQLSERYKNASAAGAMGAQTPQPTQGAVAPTPQAPAPVVPAPVPTAPSSITPAPAPALPAGARVPLQENGKTVLPPAQNLKPLPEPVRTEGSSSTLF